MPLQAIKREQLHKPVARRFVDRITFGDTLKLDGAHDGRYFSVTKLATRWAFWRTSRVIMAVMKVDLAFGKTGLPVYLPDGFRYRILEARSATPLPGWQAALESALDQPIGAAPLIELARGK